MSTDASSLSTAVAEPSLLKRAVVIDPPAGAEHKFTVIWMHGLGDAGESFVDFFEAMSLPKGTRFVLPNAPRMPVTCNGGYVMPAWFDIIKMSSQRAFEDTQDDKSILASADDIIALIDYEAARVGTAKRVLIGGFSQGAAMSLHVGPRYKEKLGGIVAASGFGLMSYHGDKYVSQKDVPLLIYHGTSDPVVKVDYARLTKAYLEKVGVAITEYIEEPGLAHSLSSAEVRKIEAFLKDCMNQA